MTFKTQTNYSSGVSDYEEDAQRKFWGEGNVSYVLGVMVT